MKIVQQTPSQLTLRLRPMFMWMLGSFFATAGLSMIISSKEVTFTCKRTESAQGSCELLASDLLESEVRKITLNILQGAKVEDKDNSYRVIVLTSSGEVPFTSYSSGLGKDEKQAIASRINDFVRTPQETSLMVQEDDRRLLYPWGAIFFAVGLFVGVFLGQIVTCLFDKSLGSFTLKRQGLFGTEVIEHQIREIADVQVEEYTDSDGSTYRVSIVLKSGNCLPLTSYYSSGRKSKQETAERICTFLNLKK